MTRPRATPLRPLRPLQEFLQTEVAGASVLLAAAVIAVVWASSPWDASYHELWGKELTVGIPAAHLTESLQHWVNDLAMALFFFVAGLEIKRELVHGELRSPRAAALPVVCAVGGMAVPALVYTAVNAGGPSANGWGIPMATDIAFALGVLALVGRRVPASMRAFLLSLAIVDDIGAIAVIAIFYSEGIRLAWLGAAVLVALAVVGLRLLGVRSLVPYVLLAGLLWLAMFESGVHATIAGVVLALLTPASPRRDGEEAPLVRLEHRLHPWSAFVVLPLFALANAGVDLTPDGGLRIVTPVAVGIVAGLVVGKPVGITLAAWLAVRVGGARLPAHAGWLEVVGVGAVAGIGFTVSLFVTSLALEDHVQSEAKIAILAASVLAATVGAILLRLRTTAHPLTPRRESAR